MDVGSAPSIPSLSWLEREGSPLPEDFLWGVAGAGYQVEGGYNGTGQPRNNWALWERSGRAVPSGSGVRFWDDWARHLDLARAMELNAFRMSLEWTRLNPRGPAERDPAAVQRYADILAGCHARGLEPIVSLHHFTTPAWLGPDPWLHPDGPEAFEAFVTGTVTTLGRMLGERGVPPVTWWITVNEPNLHSLLTYVTGAFPHERGPSPARFRRCLDHLLAAHVLGYRALHRVHDREGWAPPKVTFANHSMTAYGLDRGLLDLGVARETRVLRAHLASFLAAQRERFQVDLEGLRGPAATMADRVLERLLLPDPAAGLPSYRRALGEGDGAAHDVVAIDYSVTPAAVHLRLPFTGSWRGRRNPVVAEPWETTIDPGGLHQILRANYRWERPVPIMVAQNGMGTQVRDGRGRRRRDGWARPAYLRAHVAEVLRAAREGVQVAGYLHRTLMDGYEWGTYEARCGLYAVDRRPAEPVLLSRDALGDDSAGTYRRIVLALRTNDGPAARSALSD